jgi:hypothetical protein
VILKELLRELAAHVSAEQSLVYPVVVAEEIGGADLASGLKGDYDEIGRLLILIERRKVNSPDMPDLVTELLDATRAHIDRCQEVLFPGLEASLTMEDQVDLAARLDSADDTIVSHPHPHLLSLGPLSRFTTRLASRFDRVRDRTVDNRHGE